MGKPVPVSPAHVERVARLARQVAEEASRMLPVLCGARLPKDVLGYPVLPCCRAAGHDGECSSTQKNGRTVRWCDARAQGQGTSDGGADG